MPIIKLNAIDSTNSYLRLRCARENLDDFTVVVTENQTGGRGQMGTVWASESAKNLTFSVYKKVADVDLEYPFYISMATALAVVKALQFFAIPKLAIKWPNDILSEDKKLCGIIIENIVTQNKFMESVNGIGLNFNQSEFSKLQQSESLKL
ncbi:MAG: biotin--[acetyl-CoA-carboxylase] ligase, partial [Flavobacteriaceae bacterium]